MYPISGLSAEAVVVVERTVLLLLDSCAGRRKILFDVYRNRNVNTQRLFRDFRCTLSTAFAKNLVRSLLTRETHTRVPRGLFSSHSPQARRLIIQQYDIILLIARGNDQRIVGSQLVSYLIAFCLNSTGALYTTT